MNELDQVERDLYACIDNYIETVHTGTPEDDVTRLFSILVDYAQ